ncbi:MAG: preprotein translocase subunit YajC, partial [Acidimicrobiales bacterium]
MPTSSRGTIPLPTAIILAAAHATSSKTSSSASGTIFYLLFLVAIGYVLWRMFMRPQSQRTKAQRQLLNEVQVGDDVLTTSGIFGTVVELESDKVTLEVAPDVTIVLLRSALGQRLSSAAEASGAGRGEHEDASELGAPWDADDEPADGDDDAPDNGESDPSGATYDGDAYEAEDDPEEGSEDGSGEDHGEEVVGEHGDLPGGEEGGASGSRAETNGRASGEGVEGARTAGP